jgi:hypothetical protein
MKRYEQPKMTDGGGGPLDRRKYEHPAYGQIGASRVQGRAHLYGSDFDHNGFIQITIHRSHLQRDLSHDWHFETDELIEVYLSEAQWATFVSTLNYGQGTPCTINRLMKQDIPGIAAPRNSVDEFKEELTEKLAGIMADVDATIAGIKAEAGSLSKKRVDAMLAHMERVKRELNANLPWVAKVFGKHMETTVEKAKVEIEAYVTGTIARAGIAAIAGQAPIALGPGEPDEDT